MAKCRNALSVQYRQNKTIGDNQTFFWIQRNLIYMVIDCNLPVHTIFSLLLRNPPVKMAKCRKTSDTGQELNIQKWNIKGTKRCILREETILLMQFGSFWSAGLLNAGLLQCALIKRDLNSLKSHRFTTKSGDVPDQLIWKHHWQVHHSADLTTGKSYLNKSMHTIISNTIKPTTDDDEKLKYVWHIKISLRIFLTTFITKDQIYLKRSITGSSTP